MRKWWAIVYERKKAAATLQQDGSVLNNIMYFCYYTVDFASCLCASVFISVYMLIHYTMIFPF